MATRLVHIFIKTIFPCCNHPARLMALDLVPVERYSRKCSHCGIDWTIKRTRAASVVKGIYIDRLDWTK
jgi:hypothetical protein